MGDGWWVMSDGWWVMSDGWWVMSDGWWVMGDEWWVMSGCWMCWTLQHRCREPQDTYTESHDTVDNHVDIAVLYMWQSAAEVDSWLIDSWLIDSWLTPWIVTRLSSNLEMARTAVSSWRLSLTLAKKLPLKSEQLSSQQNVLWFNLTQSFRKLVVCVCSLCHIQGSVFPLWILLSCGCFFFFHDCLHIYYTLLIIMCEFEL